MVLATDELKKQVDNGVVDLITNYSIQGASLDLSIGEKAKIHKKGAGDIDLFTNPNLDDIYDEVDLTKGFRLEPNCYLYSETLEKVSIPLNMCGVLLPRSSFTRIGMILPISQYANPGYVGHLPIVIHNASPSVVIIPPYFRVIQLLLLELKGNAKPYKDKKGAKYHEEKGVKTPIFDDKDLDDILHKLAKRNETK